jgi:predicted CXXCH cytochrome family protein
MMNLSGNRNTVRPAAYSLLVGFIVLSLAQQAGAFASSSATANPDGETCAFSLQLQKSVAVRRDYLVKVGEALGRPSVASNAVEEMYSKINKASYPEGADSDELGSGTSSFSYGKTKAAKTLVSIDSFSADCLSCHDGVGASNVSLVLRNKPFTRMQQLDSFTSDHPIGMNYNSYVAANRGYNPIPANSKMIFVNGKVGCLSCHDPLNQEKGHLVMSDRKSALCYTCHGK